MKQVADADGRVRLLAAARAAAARAYCPYSHFHVGAAVLADRAVFAGCNVENASYGLTICAERNAIFQAVARGARRIEAVAVACPDLTESDPRRLHMPCGAYRQVMAEFANDDLPVYIDGVGSFRLGDLLPEAFHLRSDPNG